MGGESEFQIKPISADSVAEAFRKAEQYRVLNVPEQAESICLDILLAQPENPRAQVLLILSLTDQFSSPRGAGRVREARELVAKLVSEYERAYYSGVVCEREAKAYVGRGMSSVFAYDGYRDAMEWYEKAAACRPAGNDDSILRWNSCVRTIEREKLQPHHESDEPLQLE